MIKSIAISIFFLMTSPFNSVQEATTVTVVYEGVDDGIYYFSSAEDDATTYSFKHIDEKASTKYNLADRKLIGSTFKVTYTAEDLLDDENEPYEVLTLIDVTLIKKN